MDCAAWMPSGMDPALKDEFTAAYPGDCHAAAAAAWEYQAATVAASGSGGAAGVTQVSTGAQSATYADDGAGSGEVGEAIRRANWHRARARLRSVQVGPEHQVARLPRVAALADVEDFEDYGIIQTYIAPPVGEPPPQLEEWA